MIERPTNGIGEVFFEVHGGATLTNEFPVRAGTGAATTTRNSATGISFVDLIVAIVIDAIASLRRIREVWLANQRPVRALRRSKTACIGFAGIANDVSSGIAFIHHSIAIVVDAIALLSGRRNDRETIDLASLAYQLARCTNPEIPSSTIETRSRNVVIDRAITIVVDVIARLSRRHDIRHALLLARVARLLANGTRPRSTRHSTRLVAVRECLVHEQVAVVVDAVANLERRSVRDTRIQHSVFTRDDRDFTSPDTTCRHAHVVGNAVAIVIDEIAELLGLRLDLTNARSPGSRYVTLLLSR